MEARHKKGSCNTIGGTAKRKTDLSVKNEKAIIQDAQDFYQWAKITEGASPIKFTFLSSEEYENAASFLSQACSDIKTVVGAMKVYNVFPYEINSICVIEMSCFCNGCFAANFHPNTACKGWCIANLKQISNVSVSSQAISPEIEDHVAAVYDRTVYVGKVLEVNDSDAHITFYQHSRNITGLIVFRMPKCNDEVWITFNDILCVLPQPNDTKRGKRLEEAERKILNLWFFCWFITLTTVCD